MSLACLLFQVGLLEYPLPVFAYVPRFANCYCTGKVRDWVNVLASFENPKMLITLWLTDVVCLEVFMKFNYLRFVL